MDDLIDRNRLLKEIREVYEYEFPTASGAFDEFVTNILPNIIRYQPTVDAVSGVLCKYCKNRECVHDPVTGEIRNDMFFCKIVGYSSRFEFFCADGERKDGESNG